MPKQVTLNSFLGKQKSSSIFEELRRDKKIAEKIKYRCCCGKIVDFIVLLETRGKCPKCGRQLVKFNEGD
jgi:Zn finger protein HypA/HybF involved in hydrogenase expression